MLVVEERGEGWWGQGERDEKYLLGRNFDRRGVGEREEKCNLEELMDGGWG